MEPTAECNPRRVEEGDDSVLACLCTDDYCNGFEAGRQIEAPRRQEPSRKKPPKTKPPRYK